MSVWKECDTEVFKVGEGSTGLSSTCTFMGMGCLDPVIERSLVFEWLGVS